MVSDTQKYVDTLLSSLEINPGNHVVIHSSFKPLSLRGFSPDSFIQAIIDHLGDDSTLAMPTMSWREVSIENPHWDETKTPTNVGILTEVFRTQFAEQRSIHPTHSVAARGPHTNFLLKDHHTCEYPCADESPWAKLTEIDARIIMLGVGLERCTLIHHLEESLFPDHFCKPGHETYYCVDAAGTTHTIRTKRHTTDERNFPKYDPILTSHGYLKEQSDDGYRVMAFRAKDLIEVVSADLAENHLGTLVKI